MSRVRESIDQVVGGLMFDCQCFAKGYQPSEAVVREALVAGYSEDEIRAAFVQWYEDGENVDDFNVKHVPAFRRYAGEQLLQAYRDMVIKARYRAAAPPIDLVQEAREYAVNRWLKAHEQKFFVGDCDVKTRPATIFAIEAVRLLCGRQAESRFALELMKMAVASLEKVEQEARK
jgi:hypothetical protein